MRLPCNPWRAGWHPVVIDEAEARVRGQLMQSVIDANPFAVPYALVERYLEQMMGELQQTTHPHTGTTLLACERLGRRARTADLDPVYCELTIRRLEHYRATGKLGWQNGHAFEAELGLHEQITEAHHVTGRYDYLLAGHFSDLQGVDTLLGPEMKSTGEVMGIGRSFGEAYAKAQLASGVILPRQGAALLSVRDRDKDGAIELGRILTDMGFDLVATHGTAKALAEAGVSCRRANKVREGRPHIVDMIKNGEIDFIVNTTEGKQAINESHSIRAEAVRRGVTYYTTLGAAIATCQAIEHLDDSDVNRLQDLHKEVAA
mgnify:CR=1 FL=1